MWLHYEAPPKPKRPMTDEIKPCKKIEVKSPLLTRAQLADILQISTQLVVKNANKKLIKRVYIGGAERFPAHLNKVEEYIEITK
jgi:hypothetical protein